MDESIDDAVNLNWEQVVELLKTAANGQQEIGELKGHLESLQDNQRVNSQAITRIDEIIRGDNGSAKNSHSWRMAELERKVANLYKALALIGLVALGLLVDVIRSYLTG